MIQVDGIFVQQGGGGPVFPEFTYTGDYYIQKQNDNDWKIYFTTSGIFTPGNDMVCDLCVIGAGQGGQSGYFSSGNTRGVAGNPGKTVTVKNFIMKAGTDYEVSIGASGAANLGVGGNTVWGSIVANGGNSDNPISDPAYEFDDSSEPTQAGNGGDGGGVGAPGADGQDAGNVEAPEPGGAGGSAGNPGSDGSRGAAGGVQGSAGISPIGGGGGGGGGGFGASGGGGGARYSNNGANGAGGIGAPGVAILRNARGVAA